MRFAEGWDMGGILFQTVYFTSGIWFCISQPGRLSKKASEGISQPLRGLGRIPQSHSSGPPSFPVRTIAREHSLLCWVPCPQSHPHQPVSTSQPIPEGLPLRGEVDSGPRDMGLRLSFGQTWKSLLEKAT